MIDGIKITTGGMADSGNQNTSTTFVEIARLINQETPEVSPDNLKAYLEQFLRNFGHKVIYRRYHTGVKSQYYDKVMHEGVKGSKWKYTDGVIISRKSPVSLRGVKGEFVSDMVFYIIAEDKPKVNDIIIEVNADDTSASAQDSVILSSPHSMIFKIIDIDIKRGADGKIVFYQCFVAPEYGYY